MNPIAEEILMHYGMPRRSGRYPWGSGENPYQHSGDFLSRIDELKSQGMSDTEIAKAMGLTTTQYRTQKSLAKDERRALDVARAKSLREDGLSLNEIAKEMGFANDSSVRSLLNENSEVRMNQAKTTAEFIKKQIDEKGMIDVGAGVERELGISKEKLNEALYMLEMEGYPVYGGRVDQITNPGKKTTLRVICPPGTEHKEIYDFENINSLKDYVSHDDGETFDPKFVYPKSMDSKRLQIRYSEDGGELKDGVVGIRSELDLKKAAHAVKEKSVEMLKSKELLPLTGYVHGGCSPIGMKKQFTTVIHKTAKNFETMIFSGGKIGYQVELSLEDLLKVIPAKLEDVTE